MYFSQKKVLYLGHVISSEGIATDPSKTQRIVDWPTPCSVKEVQQFLGLASYYRRFIQRFAEISQPLHCLTERGRDFKWTTECDNAFAKLKLCLHSSPHSGISRFYFTLHPRHRCLSMRYWCCIVSTTRGWH